MGEAVNTLYTPYSVHTLSGTQFAEDVLSSLLGRLKDPPIHTCDSDM